MSSEKQQFWEYQALSFSADPWLQPKQTWNFLRMQKSCLCMESTFTKPRWEPACVHLLVDFVIWLSFPCRSKFNCFRKLLWKERKYGNTDIQQECLKHSCKRSDSSWFLICMSQETFQSSSYRQVLALSNLEYNIFLPREPLCSRKCRMGSRWALWATSRTGESSRREEVVRKSVKEKGGWLWSWELESGWWGGDLWEDQRDNLEGSCWHETHNPDTA